MADTVSLYNRMSPVMQRMLIGLEAVHSSSQLSEKAKKEYVSPNTLAYTQWKRTSTRCNRYGPPSHHTTSRHGRQKFIRQRGFHYKDPRHEDRRVELSATVSL